MKGEKKLQRKRSVVEKVEDSEENYIIFKNKEGRGGLGSESKRLTVGPRWPDPPSHVHVPQTAVECQRGSPVRSSPAGDRAKTTDGLKSLLSIAFGVPFPVDIARARHGLSADACKNSIKRQACAVGWRYIRQQPGCGIVYVHATLTAPIVAHFSESWQNVPNVNVGCPSTKP